MAIIAILLVLGAARVAHAQSRNGGIAGVCNGCRDDEGPYYPWILSPLNHWGYGYDSLLVELEKWRRDPFIHVDSVGASVLGRAIWELTITDPASGGPKHTIFIHARTHPSEVQAFRVTDAIIDYLTSDVPYARQLRAHTTFHIMPMYNPDGVELELARQNAHEIDLERNWDAASPEPEVATLRRRFVQLMASDGPIEIALNMHSAGDCKRYFVYHDTIGVSVFYTRMEQHFIADVRSFFPTGIENYTFDQRWQSGALTNFPEGWWWIEHGDHVLALTYEDMNCPDAGEYDSTAYAILHGIGGYLDIRDEAAVPHVATLPEEVTLLGAYPNPFKTQTTIRYLLPRRESVRIAIMNLLGEEIDTIVDGTRDAGEHEAVWRPRNVSDGVYLCSLQIGNVARTVMLRLVRGQ
jgi:hypothetical protein